MGFGLERSSEALARMFYVLSEVARFPSLEFNAHVKNQEGEERTDRAMDGSLNPLVA